TATARGTRRSSSARLRTGGTLRVSLDEPQPLVDTPRDLRADVGRVRVPQFVRLADGLADALPETRQCIGQRPDVLLAARDVDGVLRQLGSLGHNRTGPFRDAERSELPQYPINISSGEEH